jgi:hypothetical protein
MGVVQGDELLLLPCSENADPGNLGAEAGPDRGLERPLELQGPAGFLLHQPLDLGLVAVGVEGQGEDERRDDDKEYQTEYADQAVFQRFIHSNSVCCNA